MEVPTVASVLAVIRASSPNLRTPEEHVVFALHATFLSCGYSAVAVGEAAEADPPAPSVTSAAFGTSSIDGWNASPDWFAFRYIREEDQSPGGDHLETSAGDRKGGLAKEGVGGRQGGLLVKLLVAGEELMVDAVGPGCSSEPSHTELRTADFVNTADLTSPSYARRYRNLDRLVQRVHVDIISSIADARGVRASVGAGPPPTSRPSQPSPPPPSIDGGSPLVDPLATGRGPAGPYGPPRVPIVGEADLLPGGGFAVGPPGFGPGGGGGMLVGPGDPFFSDRFERPGGRLPTGLPPGARFDPYGPPGFPGFEPDRFGGGRPRSFGPRGRHPDLEDFRPAD